MKVLGPIFCMIICLCSVSAAINNVDYTISWVYYGVAILSVGYFLKFLFSGFTENIEYKLKKTSSHVVMYFRQYKVGSVHDVILFLKEHNCLYDDDRAIKTIADTLRSMHIQGSILLLTDDVNSEIDENTVWLSTFEEANIQQQIISI